MNELPKPNTRRKGPGLPCRRRSNKDTAPSRMPLVRNERPMGNCVSSCVMRGRVRSEQETGDALGISCIGLVPLLPRTHAIRPYQYLLTEPFSAYAEAIRSAVATLGLAAGSARTCEVVLISSSVPGEGKTTLALS